MSAADLVGMQLTSFRSEQEVRRRCGWGADSNWPKGYFVAYTDWDTFDPSRTASVRKTDWSYIPIR